MDFDVEGARPSKIKVFFLWGLAKATAGTLHHRKMANDDKCAECGMQDSWRHSPIECTMSKYFWAMVAEEVEE